MYLSGRSEVGGWREGAEGLKTFFCDAYNKSMACVNTKRCFLTFETLKISCFLHQKWGKIQVFNPYFTPANKKEKVTY